jgi:hypothetical protein
MRDIDGRLRMAQGTRCIRGIELALVHKTFRAGVGPVRVGFLSSAQGRQATQAQDKSKQNSSAEWMRTHGTFSSERFEWNLLLEQVATNVVAIENNKKGIATNQQNIDCSVCWTRDRRRTH